MVGVKEQTLPAIEQLLRQDLLVKAGPIKWSQPTWQHWSSSNRTNISTVGRMTDPRGIITCELYPPRSSRAGLEGLDLDRGYVSIALPVPQDLQGGLEVSEGSQEQELRASQKARLAAFGVLRPEFVNRFTPVHTNDQWVFGVTDYHGMSYKVSLSNFGQLYAGGPSGEYMTIECHGAYSSAG